jgi:plastocyanin domain-containing protein
MRCSKNMLLIAGLLAFVASIAWGDELKEKRVVATVNPDGIQRVEVLGGEYYFDPNVIVVRVNVPVELVVGKAGGFTPHDIVLKAPDAGINFAESLSGEPKTIRFTPTKVGKYPFECSKRLLFFKSHKDQGMHGVLEVVE